MVVWSQIEWSGAMQWLLHSTWFFIILPIMYFILLDSTAFYHSCTSLYVLHSTLLYHCYNSFCTWLYIILPWLYTILPDSTLLYHGSTLLYLTVHYTALYHSSTSHYLILKYSTIVVLHSTWLYITLLWLYFTLLHSTLLFHGSPPSLYCLLP